MPHALCRFDNLFAATSGARPQERRHMFWVNTALFENMELSRGAVMAFNDSQPPGTRQVPMYPCHVHGLLWPEKMTKDRLIHRFVVRHLDPRVHSQEPGSSAVPEGACLRGHDPAGQAGPSGLAP